VYSVIGVIVYLYFAYCLRELARKRAMPRPWLAWIPFANEWLACRIAGHGIVWTILLFVPIVNLLMLALLGMKYAAMTGHRRVFGLLLLVPFANYVALWVICFGEAGLRPIDPRWNLSGASAAGP